jgi:hypothetical protein
MINIHLLAIALSIVWLFATLHLVLIVLLLSLVWGLILGITIVQVVIHSSLLKGDLRTVITSLCSTTAHLYKQHS